MQSQMLHGRIWIMAVEFPHRVRIKFQLLTHIYGQNSPSALATQLLGPSFPQIPAIPCFPQKASLALRPSTLSKCPWFKFPSGVTKWPGQFARIFFFLSFHPSHHFPGNHFVRSKVTNLTKSTRTKGTISRSPIVAGKCICVLPQRRGRAERGFFLLG